MYVVLLLSKQNPLPRTPSQDGYLLAIRHGKMSMNTTLCSSPTVSPQLAQRSKTVFQATWLILYAEIFFLNVVSDI